MSIQEIKEEFVKFLEYCNECWEKAPPDVKEGLIPGVFAFTSIIWKFVETHKISGLSDKFSEMADHCPEVAEITSKTNKMVGIGMALEIISLVGQYWRLKEFTELLEKASNLRNKSREKLIEAVKHLKEAEQLIKQFESFYKVQDKTITLNEFWEMSKTKDDINDKLNEVKDCIRVLEFQVGNQAEILQMKGTGIAIDAVSGALSGTLSMISALIAADICNPWIALGAGVVGGARLILGIAGTNKYFVSKDTIKQLQAELDNIQELGKKHKLLQENFKKLIKSICLREMPDGGYQIVIKQTA